MDRPTGQVICRYERARPGARVLSRAGAGHCCPRQRGLGQSASVPALAAQRVVTPQGHHAEPLPQLVLVCATSLVGMAIGAEGNHRARVVAPTCRVVVDVIDFEERFPRRRAIRQVWQKTLRALTAAFAAPENRPSRGVVPVPALCRRRTADLVPARCFTLQQCVACGVVGSLIRDDPHTHPPKCVRHWFKPGEPDITSSSRRRSARLRWRNSWPLNERRQPVLSVHGCSRSPRSLQAESVSRPAL